MRQGLAAAVTGASVAGVEVKDHRALKRHIPIVGDDGLGGHGVTMTPEAGRLRAADFERRLTGATFSAPARRGKFMWLPLEHAGVRASPVGVSGAHDASASPQALLAHLGMSGQMLLRSHDAADDRHVRVRLWIEHPHHGELRLDFADQRLFGSLAIDALVSTSDGAAGGLGTDMPALPGQAVHIARDPLDPAFRDDAFVTRLRGRNVAVKSALLDQSLDRKSVV